METTNSPKTFTTSSTQTEQTSNKGRGLEPLDPTKHEELFSAHNDLPTPEYRSNLTKVFNEEFIAEASQKELKIIMDYVTTRNWEDLKKVNPIYYKIRRDLSVTPTNCLLYDNKIVIPNRLKQLVLDTIHHKHPGQAGMLALAKMIWWPHIHSEIVSKAKSCRQCIDKGKNLKAIEPYSQLGKLNSLREPNEEIQMDFAGPIPFKNNIQNNYILVTVDRLSRYPHAETFHNCDTDTAIDYLERYCKIHGIPRSIRCDQAQAFKAKEFEIFCKNKNIKLILAPAGDHRGTGMVERLIQTIKRRLAVLDIDPMWSTESLSSRIANIIENIRLIPNKTTKVTPFEAHFGRKPNTELTNILTKPSTKNLTYKSLKTKCLDKQILRQDALTQEEMWRRDGNSEDELDLQYRDNTPHGVPQIQVDSDDSENRPLVRRSPSKISPSELHFSIGDKTTKIIYNRRNVARKSIARKAKEPRNTLASQWNIIPDGTITNYTPHTITIDTPLRKNTVIRKNHIAIATETVPIPETKPIPEPKPRLIHMVACETVGEYKRNQEKIRKFCLEEAKKARQQKQAPLEPNVAIMQHQPGPSSAIQKPPQAPKRKRAEVETKTTTNTKEAPKPATRWSKERVRKIATKNQRQHQKANTNITKGVKTTKGKKSEHSTPLSFNEKAKPAAIRQSMIASTRRMQSTTSDTETKRSFLIFNTPTPQPPSMQIFNIETETPTGNSYEIITSNNPNDFMETSSLSPTTNTAQPFASTSVYTRNTENATEQIEFTKSTTKLDKIVRKIQSINEDKNNTTSPSYQQEPQIIYLNSSNSPNKDSEIEELHPETDNKESNVEEIHPKTDTKTAPTPIGATNRENDDISATKQHEDNIKSPASSLIYKTPPSSPPPDTISDLDEEDIKSLNEIQ